MLCKVYSSAISDFKSNKLVDPLLDQLFMDAHKSILTDSGNVDEGLRVGNLLSSNSIRMLDRATGEDCYDIEKWSVEKVREMNQVANWDFRYLNEYTWAYLSAKAFLSICSKSGLGINFFLKNAVGSEV